MWFPIGGDARLGQCATEGCGQHPSWRLESDDIGSDYCDPCRRKIEEICCGCGAGHGSLEGHMGWCDMAETNGMDAMQHEANKQSDLNMIAAAEREAELIRLRAENERLREALEPFSGMAGELFARNFNAKDVVVRLRHRPFIDGEGRRELTFWHFVRARKALEGE